MADFTEKQVGKRVVAANGVQVGTVDDVRDGSLYVTVSSGADRDTLEDLEWEGVVNQEVHHLRHQYIGDITDETIRLSV
ncbi:hypothetical protein [Halomicrococcus sp. SG-WS-1]|uniref:hypothetical protein n=1 Tax=Halomicrococcus sp. SG-WS-1 TaxID=3439057 RepID=UPI003F798A01